MRISYAKFEEVDEVLTLTLAEGPGENGATIHFMRALWEDDDDVHQVDNGRHESVDAAVRSWTLDGHLLTVTFHEAAAAQLRCPETTVWELDLDDAAVGEVHAHLREILVDVPETLRPLEPGAGARRRHGVRVTAYASLALVQLTETVMAPPLTVARPLETTVGALTYALVDGIRSTSTFTEPLVVSQDGMPV